MTDPETIKALLAAAARDQQTPLGKPRSVTSLVRRHLELLTLLRSEGEKWQDIADALAGAGIRAPNGSPIGAQVLSNLYKAERSSLAFAARSGRHQAGPAETGPAIGRSIPASAPRPTVAPTLSPPYPPPPSDPNPLLTDVGEPGLTAAQRIALRRNRTADQT